jgi:hypothetical protein
MKEVCISIDEGGNIALCGYGRAVDQNNMTPYPKCRHGEGHANRFFSSSGLCHHCRAGKYLGTMKFEDGAVDSGSKPKVIGIHDKTRHEDKLINPMRNWLR